jgi:hypothetical protein
MNAQGEVIAHLVSQLATDSIVNPAAFQDILKWRRCSCDASGFIELFYLLIRSAQLVTGPDTPVS